MKSESKYKNDVVEKDGYSFASKLESSVYQILKFRQSAGELDILQTQDHIKICGAPGHLCKKAITYIADFKCKDLKTNEIFWVEAKGYANDRWPMKKNLFQHYGTGRLEIWGGTHSRPILLETVIPLP